MGCRKIALGRGARNVEENVGDPSKRRSDNNPFATGSRKNVHNGANSVGIGKRRSAKLVHRNWVGDRSHISIGLFMPACKAHVEAGQSMPCEIMSANYGRQQ